MTKVLLIQPWFCAPGHPAQTTLNFSRVVPSERLAGFLIAKPAGTALTATADKLSQQTQVTVFRSYGTTLRANTFFSLTRLYLFSWSLRTPQVVILFLDGDLDLLAIFSWLPFIPRPLYLIVLGGPERVAKSLPRRVAVEGALRKHRLVVLLRTQELMDSWVSSFPRCQAAFRLLPPIEGVCETGRAKPKGNASRGPLKIGIIGQIRQGRCIPAMLKLADSLSECISVVVCGPVSPANPTAFTSTVTEHPRVKIKYLAEEEMIAMAQEQDYLSCLVEQQHWDTRMESATLWLAVKTNVPVLGFAAGWVGRMITETGCGTIMSALTEAQLLAVPRPGSAEYERIMECIQRLRCMLTPHALWGDLGALLGIHELPAH